MSSKNLLKGLNSMFSKYISFQIFLTHIARLNNLNKLVVNKNIVKKIFKKQLIYSC